MSMIVSRFAPSPTGRLHLGHAFSAVRAHDLARAAGGRFLLRIEDIDPGRTREDFVAGVLEDLRWLGLAWDEPVVRQSARLDVYAAALERLKGRGLVYPCFCTRSEIAESVAAPHGATAAYPGTCRGRVVDSGRLEREPHCWRLDMERAFSTVCPEPVEGPSFSSGVEKKDSASTSSARTELGWFDASAGWVPARPEAQGDVVLARKDAPVSYHLAVTVDDGAQGVTDVVRGVDLFQATHVHRVLQALLGLPTPVYHHHALLTGPDGRRLAKRDGAKSLAALRAEGADPGELVASLRSAPVKGSDAGAVFDQQVRQTAF